MNEVVENFWNIEMLWCLSFKRQPVTYMATLADLIYATSFGKAQVVFSKKSLTMVTGLISRCWCGESTTVTSIKSGLTLVACLKCRSWSRFMKRSETICFLLKRSDVEWLNLVI